MLAILILLTISVVNSQDESNTQENYPNINIHCIENCTPMELYKDSLVSVSCEGCETPPDGTMTLKGNKGPCADEEEPCDAIEELGEGKYKIKSDVLTSDTKYDIIFTREKPYYLSVGTSKCEMQISCQSNCEYDVTDIIWLEVAITCEKTYDGEIHWVLKGGDESFKYEGADIAITENTLKPGYQYTVTADIGHSRTSFQLGSGGQCDLNVDEDIDEKHNLKLTCTHPEETELVVLMSHPPHTNKIQIFKGTYGNAQLLIEEHKMTNVEIQIGGNQFTFEDILVGEEMTEEPHSVVVEVVGKKDYSITTLLEAKKFDDAYEHSLNLIDDINTVENEKLKTNLQRHLAADLRILVNHQGTENMVEVILKSLSDLEVDAITINLLAQCALKVTENALSKDLSKIDLIANMTSALSKTLDLVEIPSITPVTDTLDYPTYDDWEYKTVAVKQQVRESTLSIIKIISSLGVFKGKLESETFVMKTQYLDGKALKINFEDKLSEVAISKDLANELSTYPDAYIQVVLFNKNPFWWDKTGKDIGSDVVMINVVSHNHSVTNIKESIHLYLYVNDSTSAIIEDVLTQNDSNWRVHRIETKNNSKVTVEFNAATEDFHAILTNYYPTLQNLRDHGQLIQVGADRVMSIDTGEPLVYVAIGRRRGSSIEYRLTVTSVQCIIWSGMEWDWTSKGCTFGNDSISTKTHCICNHLSLFGSSFLVAPNKIEVFTGLTFAGSLKESRIIISTVGIILLLYLCALAWAARRDRILDNRTVCLLPDTIPGDKHMYLVGVLTGIFKGSATTAHICIQLFGLESNSRRHILPSNSQQGDEDWYTMATPEPLGHIYAVRVFHDSYGNRPHWYCERIIVRDLSQCKQYTFNAQTWLSLLESDGKTDRILKLSENVGNLKKCSTLFSIHARNAVRDTHLLLSVFTRPPDSTFTCKERITCATAVLFLSLTSSAMFYGTTEMDPQGSFFFTMRELAIIVESLIVTVPLGVVLTILFRKSKPLK